MALRKKTEGATKAIPSAKTADMQTLAYRLVKREKGSNFSAEPIADSGLVQIYFHMNRVPMQITLSPRDFATAPDPIAYLQEQFKFE